jgi:hypothetical protein
MAEVAGHPTPDLRDRLQTYLRAVRGPSAQVSALKQYPSGFSWITHGFQLTEAGNVAQDLILRLGPSNGLFAPYSAEPEYAAFAAMQGTPVPAPAPRHWSDDTTILGHPFLIVDKASGDTPIGVSGQGIRLYPNDMFTNDLRLAASGEPLPFFNSTQVTYLEINANITAAGELMSDPDGKGIAAATGGKVGAVAIQSGTAGQLILVKVVQAYTK